MTQRQEMNKMLSTARRETYASQWGLSFIEPALFKITPALDIIVARPGDPAHSEYGDLYKLLHSLFLETILTPATVIEYATLLRR